MKDWHIEKYAGRYWLYHTCHRAGKHNAVARAGGYMCDHINTGYMCGKCHTLAPEEIQFVAELASCVVLKHHHCKPEDNSK